MAFFDTTWYCNFGDGSTTGYYAVPQFAAVNSYAAGALIRQLTTPTVGNERVFVCIVAGTSVAEPTWTVTRGAKNTSTTPVFQECTGAAGVNGDLTNCPNWTIVKNSAVTLGQVIQRNNGASLQICSTAGTAGNGAEPAFSNTAGVTTADGTITWTSLGVVANFPAWSAPFARIQTAFTNTWMVAGNTLFVGDNHAETQAAAMTLSNGSQVSPFLVYCVDHTASVPPGPSNLKTTATVTTTGASALNISCVAIWNGIQFSGGSGAVGNGIVFSAYNQLVNCALSVPGTSGAPINGSAASFIDLFNTTCSFGSSSGNISLTNSSLRWRNTASAVGGTAPSVLIKSNGVSIVTLDGVDLSAVSGTIFTENSSPAPLLATAQNCKLNASATVGGTLSVRGEQVYSILSDSSGTTYQQGIAAFEGVLSASPSVCRTGGASNGVTPIGWQMVTTANVAWQIPFVSFPVAQWNTSLTSKTITVFGVWGGAAVPNNDNIWIGVESLGSASSPIATFTNCTKANGLASGSALTADTTSDWTGGAAAYQTSHAYGAGTGVVIKAGNASPQQIWFVASHSGSGTSGTNTAIFNGQADGAQVTDNAGANQIVWQAYTRFSMAVSVTPALVGDIIATVYAASPSTTFFVDPKIVVS